MYMYRKSKDVDIVSRPSDVACDIKAVVLECTMTSSDSCTVARCRSDDIVLHHIRKFQENSEISIRKIVENSLRCGTEILAENLQSDKIL